ncbi:MAG: diguanylate cyclase [Magnetococcus sp. MYC-9]
MAHASTQEALEELLILLNGKPEETPRALAQVERMLQQQTCVKEVQAAGTVAASIVEQLILPALSQDPDRLEQARRLHAHLVRTAEAADGETAESSGEEGKFVESAILALRAGMPVENMPRTEENLPRALSARLAMALHLVGESEGAIREQVARWQEKGAPDWAEARQLLEQIRTAGHKAAAAPWLRQRRALYDTLLRIANGYEEELTQLGRQSAQLTGLGEAARRIDHRVDLRRFHALLQAQVMELQKEARSLRAQQEEGRQRAEQFKSRVDQLEASLSQARREQFLDPVTGIPDRFAFMAHLHRHLERALHLGEHFSLLLFHFYELQQLLERIEQTGGMLQGVMEQRLLMAVVQEMRPHLPASAFLARLSAERMVILLPKCTQDEGEEMGTFIDQLLAEICFDLDGQQIVIQANYGCAAFQQGMDVAQMLETTDRLAAAAHTERQAEQTTKRRLRRC